MASIKRIVSIFEHGGTHSGYRSKLKIIPSLELVVIVLSNFGNVPVDIITNGLAEIAITNKPLKAPIPTPITISRSDKENWEGKYSGDKYNFEVKANLKTVNMTLFNKKGEFIKGPLEYLFSDVISAFSRNHPQLKLKIENNKLKIVDFGKIKAIAKKVK